MHIKSWLENLNGRNRLEDLVVDVRITEWISGKWGEMVWAGCVWLRIGARGGDCEHGNEHSGSI